jgi:hypothetical protein
VPLISTTSASSDASTRIDRDRDRDLVARAERAERLAAQLDAMCDDGERELREAVAARDDQQIAWLVLCDRGWPRTATKQPPDLSQSYAWLETWSEQVALPVRITTARDMVKLRHVRRRLERCESDLKRELPHGLWRIVEPLDDTGRSTLAYVLHALLAWCDACARCDTAARAKERLAIRFSLFAQHVRALGLMLPAARLDLEGWRGVAVAARLVAATARATNAA